MTDVEVFLVYRNGIDWSDGRSYFESVYGTLDQAKEAIPESIRGEEKEPDRRLYDESYVLDYGYYTIRKQLIKVPS